MSVGRPQGRAPLGVLEVLEAEVPSITCAARAGRCCRAAFARFRSDARRRGAAAPGRRFRALQGSNAARASLISASADDATRGCRQATFSTCACDRVALPTGMVKLRPRRGPSPRARARRRSGRLRAGRRRRDARLRLVVVACPSICRRTGCGSTRGAGPATSEGGAGRARSRPPRAAPHRTFGCAPRWRLLPLQGWWTRRARRNGPTFRDRA